MCIYASNTFFFFRALSGLIQRNTSTALPMVLDLCQKMDPSGNHPFLLTHLPDSTNLINFVTRLIEDSIASLRASLPNGRKISKFEDFLKLEPALMWVALNCFPYIVGSGDDHLGRAWEFAVAIEDYITAFDKGM